MPSERTAGAAADISAASEDDEASEAELPALQNDPAAADASDPNMPELTDPGEQQISFRDAEGNEYAAETDPSVSPNSYDRRLFVHDGDRLTYNDPDHPGSQGIDVSSHQGEIDWQQVRDAGIEFVFVRIGYRGYGPEGTLVEDEYALTNIDRAKEAGLEVGGYFFSQAVDEEEAEEEAVFAMSVLGGRDLDLPLVFDAEHIRNDTARTDSVNGAQFTKNAAAFCSAVKRGGYEPMIYTNLLWEVFVFDMEELAAYPVWYADYEGVPQTPWDFDFWQYSETGSVNGIEGAVDMDIRMR